MANSVLIPICMQDKLVQLDKSLFTTKTPRPSESTKKCQFQLLIFFLGDLGALALKLSPPLYMGPGPDPPGYTRGLDIRGVMSDKTPPAAKDLSELEKPLLELEAQIRTLEMDPSRTKEKEKLERKLDKMKAEVFANITDWQRAQLARHPRRPYCLDYLERICDNFAEIHGDRNFGDDAAIVGGLGWIGRKPLMIIGQQKGRDTKQKILRNFGMPKPEGYRKAIRVMQIGAKFGRPIVTFLDTPGAYPGIDAEERGQAEAIGRSLYVMAELKVPIVCTVIGEGGSGGALAIAVGDIVMMMQYATYSVISPEGCASILWKSSDRAADAAEILGITAIRLKSLGLVDKIINEPLGGAHRDHAGAAQNLKKALQDALRQLSDKGTAELVGERFERLMGYGKFKELELR
jgi:acetyl-CoA carboxylase carboxyl transferase subunit alpha